MPSAISIKRFDVNRRKVALAFPIGLQHGFWTVLDEPILQEISGRLRWYVMARCQCGVEKLVQVTRLKNGNALSCGCLRTERRDKAATKHGLSKSGIYEVWSGIIARCYHTACRAYRHYGGRGIVLCDEWKDVAIFYAWMVQAGWRRGLEIDRIDNDGPYAPANCRLTTRREQMRNCRNNRIFSAFGETKCLIEWSEDQRCNVSYGSLKWRIRNGWKPEEAITKLTTQ